MKFDSTQYECALSLAMIRPPGKFAVELSTDSGKQSVRTACLLDAHSHIIQTTALLTGLALLKSKKISSRPRVLVTSNESPFMRMLREGRFDRLIIPDAMRERLKHELQGVNANFLFNHEPRFLIVLGNWLHAAPLDVLDGLRGMIQQKTVAA